MATKQERWYETEGDEARIYDHPFPERATSVSVVRLADLAYYRAHFHLTRCWGR